GGQPSAMCDALPTETNGRIIPGIRTQRSQNFKGRQLRNMYQKGGFKLASGSNKRGYGFIHDGSVDNRVNFLRAPVFSFPDTNARYSIEAFLLSFDTGTGPSVGRELTIGGASKNRPGVVALRGSRYPAAGLGSCDLIRPGRL